MRIHNVVALSVLFGATGCASVATIPSRLANRVVDFVQYKERDIQAVMKIRDAERDTLKAELDADRESELALRLAETNAERERIRQDQQYRTEALRAETEWRAQEMSKNFNDTVQSSLNLDLEQNLMFGAIEVDVDKLQKVLAEKEKKYVAELKEYEQQERLDRLVALRNTERLQDAEVTQASFTTGGPECAAPAPSPNDCANPPKRPQRTPPKKPQLTPTDVPLKIDVTMRVGLNDRGISKTQIQRLPQKSPCAPQSGCKTDGPCPMQCPPCEK